MYLSRYIVCEHCESKPATITVWEEKVPNARGGDAIEQYLCDKCAQELYPDQYSAMEPNK